MIPEAVAELWQEAAVFMVSGFSGGPPFGLSLLVWFRGLGFKV